MRRVPLLGGSWGVRSAAAGVAVGGLAMVAVQVPSLWEELRTRVPARGRRARTGRADRATVTGPAAAGSPARPVDSALLGSVLLFALCRQSQVLIERFLASTLPAGAISHLNYAQKVAQIPMTLSLMPCRRWCRVGRGRPRGGARRQGGGRGDRRRDDGRPPSSAVLCDSHP